MEELVFLFTWRYGTEGAGEGGGGRERRKGRGRASKRGRSETEMEREGLCVCVWGGGGGGVEGRAVSLTIPESDDNTTLGYMYMMCTVMYT